MELFYLAPTSLSLFPAKVRIFSQVVGIENIKPPCERLYVFGVFHSARYIFYVPIMPPSVLRITMVPERGLPPVGPSGQAPTALVLAGSPRSLGVSPGC